MLTSAMQKPEEDPYGNVTLKFICKFLASFPEDLDDSPYKKIFHWILNVSVNKIQITYIIIKQL